MSDSVAEYLRFSSGSVVGLLVMVYRREKTSMKSGNEQRFSYQFWRSVKDTKLTRFVAVSFFSRSFNRV